MKRHATKGFISYLALLLTFLAVSLFTVFFFSQTNAVRKTQEQVDTARAEARAKLFLAANLGKGVKAPIDRGLSKASPDQGLGGALSAFLGAYGSGTFDCSTSGYTVFVLYQASYSQASGTCAELVKALGAQFPNYTPPGSIESPSVSGGAYTYTGTLTKLPYTVVALRAEGNRVKSIGVAQESLDLYGIESSYPLPYQIGQVSPSNALRNNPMAPGNIWDTPVLFVGASDTQGGRVYEVYAPASLPPSAMPAHFEYGLMASGCTDIENPNSCSYRLSSEPNVLFREMDLSTGRVTPAPPSREYWPTRSFPSSLSLGRGVSYYGRYWATPTRIGNHISNVVLLPPSGVRVNAFFGVSFTVELEAPADTTQTVRVNGTSYSIDPSALNIFYFPIGNVSVKGPTVGYALAPQASNGLALIAKGNVSIETPILSRSPYCTRPPLLRKDSSSNLYYIDRSCPGQPPQQPLYLVSLGGDILINYLLAEVPLNQVFLIAPNGAFRLSNVPVQSGSLPSTLGLHVVGGMWVKTFGPWNVSSYPNLTWRFTFTAMPLGLQASTALFPQARSSEPIATFSVK